MKYLKSLEIDSEMLNRIFSSVSRLTLLMTSMLPLILYYIIILVKVVLYLSQFQVPHEKRATTSGKSVRILFIGVTYGVVLLRK